ncbi:hypothetical protein [Halobaculum sp. MBLA0143]|uniref:hypothetical protein n=1 Tax=Halobaculum sp. MBLA0143 TaxID=3079933 RepID=UPI003523BDC8
MSQTDAAVLHEETQPMRQPWLWGFLVISGFVTTVTVGAVVAADSDSLREAAVWIAGLVLLTVVVPFAGLWITRLELTVRTDGVYYRFFPLELSERRIRPSDIERFEVAEPTATMGRGVRSGDEGIEYVVAGSDGIRFYRHGDDPVYVGSQEIEAFRRAVERL